jgi:hypothetical protein
MIRVASHFKDGNGDAIRLKVGINAGPAVAGIIGNTRKFYRLFGDTVNTASRMQRHGECSTIHFTANVYNSIGPENLERNGIHAKERTLEVKGKGEMTTYIVDNFSSNPNKMFNLTTPSQILGNLKLTDYDLSAASEQNPDQENRMVEQRADKILALHFEAKMQRKGGRRFSFGASLNTPTSKDKRRMSSLMGVRQMASGKMNSGKHSSARERSPMEVSASNDRVALGTMLAVPKTRMAALPILPSRLKRQNSKAGKLFSGRAASRRTSRSRKASRVENNSPTSLNTKTKYLSNLNYFIKQSVEENFLDSHFKGDFTRLKHILGNTIKGGICASIVVFAFQSSELSQCGDLTKTEASFRRLLAFMFSSAIFLAATYSCRGFVSFLFKPVVPFGEGIIFEDNAKTHHISKSHKKGLLPRFCEAFKADLKDARACMNGCKIFIILMKLCIILASMVILNSIECSWFMPCWILGSAHYVMDVRVACALYFVGVVTCTSVVHIFIVEGPSFAFALKFCGISLLLVLVSLERKMYDAGRHR